MAPRPETTLLLADPTERAPLEEHLAELRATFARFLMTWSVVVDVVWWATDPFLLRAIPGGVAAFFGMRVCVLASGLVVLALLHGRRSLAGPRLLACVVVWLVEAAGMAAALSRLGDFSTFWFHGLYPVVIATCVFPFDLPRRTLFASAMGAALLTGFCLVRPDAMRPPFFGPTVGYMVFSVGVSVAFGHRFFLLTCENFAQRRALAAQREDLRCQVDERTLELRRLAEHLDRGSEEERRHLARELHDELGQGVSALRLTLATARRRFERDPASIRANLDDLDDLVRRVAVSTRDALTHLRPRVLDDVGLVAAAEWLVQSTERHGELTIALRVEGDEPRGAPAEADPGERAADPLSLAAFRILQEALTNVLRHAGARRVEVTLTLGPGVALQVDDDGVGLPLGATPGRGLGLIGMRERARALGGSVVVEPRPGGGTRVRCHLPAEGAAE